MMQRYYKKIINNQLQEKLKLDNLISELKVKKIKGIIITNNITKNEKILEYYADEIRSAYIDKILKTTIPIYRSPIQHSIMDDIKFNDYEYERIIKNNKLEEFYNNDILDYVSFTRIYANGMAAIINTLISIKSIHSRKMEGVLDGNYFETNNLFYILKNMDIRGYKKLENSELKNINFYFFEPVKYSFKKEENNYIKKINSISNEQTYLFLIIDISLCGGVFNIEELVSKIKYKTKIIIVLVESLLKLSQQGMELTNAGRATWMFRKEDLKLYDVLKDLTTKVIQVSGASLSDYNSKLLYNPSFLKNYEYSRKILDNNYELYIHIKNIKNEIIEEVIFMNDICLSENFGLPFVFIKLSRTDEYFNKTFLSYLQIKYEEVNLKLDVRDSFGFRNISVQYFKDIDSEECIFKIAVGLLKGMKYYLIQELILETNNITIDQFLEDYGVKR